VLLAICDKLAEPVTPGAYVCRHVVDGLYGQMLSMTNGGSAIQWVFALLGCGKPRVCDVDALASAAPAGSDGLRFWPLLAQSPTAGALAGKGGRLGGIAFAHSTGHLVRAVIEGLSCELARHLRMLEAAGVSVERLLVSGGAAASSLTPQVLAGVTGKPVTCVTQESVSAFGAAVLARAMLEGDLAHLARRLAPGGKAVTPGPDAELYRKVLEEYLAPFGP
jgi:sugar (pentulose or hexulose) kinase